MSPRMELIEHGIFVVVPDVGQPWIIREIQRSFAVTPALQPFKNGIRFVRREFVYQFMKSISTLHAASILAVVVL